MAQAPPPAVPETLPGRRLPLLYFGFARFCLALAFAAAALGPRGLGGFAYHPRMLAVVHLVTLGWITSSILGALYIVGPLALRMPLPVRRLDYVAWGFFVVGTVGVVGHLGPDAPRGMAWAAGMATLAIAHMALRVLRSLPSAPVPREVKLHVGFAFTNILAAATFGILLALNRASPFLPGYVVSNVYAHAHLAALGWATMMVMGAGYRMLPMMLPAAMPRGAGPYASALLLEAGTLGVFVSLLLQSRALGPFAVVAAAGLLAFFSQVLWMLRHLRPAPRDLLRPDFGVLHAFLALLCLGLAAALGLVLAFAPPSEWTLRAQMAYGCLGLVGFLSQVVVGVDNRLLPLVSWLWGFAGRGYVETPPPLHSLANRRLQAAVFGLWLVGLPLLTAGLFATRDRWIAGGGWALLAAVALGALNARTVLKSAGLTQRATSG